MDKFARNYLIGLITVLAMGFLWYWSSQDSRVTEINDRLALDSQLASYPFPFRVESLENGIAIMNSPRSAEVPAMRFLRTAFPELSKTAVDHPEMMKAQDTLAETQSRAAELVRSFPDVNNVRWVIDERWFNEHGVFLNLEN
ncbi:hypothetical protein [Congregibacter litoralis]|uniref:Uncharacterized protein n=1 Tax=Congregibacter litoralis KT71 TaxID=314285 RepID=A4A5W9_9GAMM|nr:hypothetical protein [Congregibacter litoralis]EAQ98416.1 hypothetical protein KT71_00525 [Congregibacter litoralis KT71]